MKKITVLIIIVFIGYGCAHDKNSKRSVSVKNEAERTYHEEQPHATNKKTEEAVLNTGRWFEPLTLDTTLTFKDNIKITLKQTDSIYINEYFLENKILDSLIKPYNNRYIEALEIEKYLLRNTTNIAKRDTNGLYLKLKNGDWKLLTLDTDSDESDHTFEYFFRESGYYSVRVQWGEGNGYKLINYSSGKTTSLFGRPYFSPDGNFVIAVNADIEAGYSSNGFQLFRNKDGQLQHLGEYEPDNWGVISAKWISNNTIIIKCETVEFSNNNSGYLEFYSELIVNNND